MGWVRGVRQRCSAPGLVTKWHAGLMTKWPAGLMTKWHAGLMTKWPAGLRPEGEGTMTKRSSSMSEPRAYQA